MIADSPLPVSANAPVTSPIATAVAKRIDKAIADKVVSAVKTGTILSVNTTSRVVSVDIGGGVVISGIPWIVPYASATVNPAVGDFVDIIQVANSWHVLGKNSRQFTGGSYVTIGATPYEFFSGSGLVADDSTWMWNSIPWTATNPLTQGRLGQWAYAAAATYDLASRVPAGVIMSGKLRLTRSTGVGSTTAISPVLYRHSLSSPPGQGEAPAGVLIAGSWAPGKLAWGQTATWDMPSDWTAGLASGELTGIAVASAMSTDYAAYSDATISILIREIS